MNENDPSRDERLLVQAAQLDPRRFADLYEQNFERVYAFIAGRVKSRAAAQDLTAQVFHSALSNLGRYEWTGKPFAAWLYRIAANAIADHFQQTAREQSLDDSQPAAAADELHEVEWRARLFRLVNELPEDQRRVITLRFAEEKSIKETAERLRRTEGAVKQLQMRALRNLRLKLEEGQHG